MYTTNDKCYDLSSEKKIEKRAYLYAYNNSIECGQILRNTSLLLALGKIILIQYTKVIHSVPEYCKNYISMIESTSKNKVKKYKASKFYFRK